MNIIGQFTRPDDLEFEMIIKMKVGEWRQLRGQLNAGHWPSSRLNDQIADILNQVESRFYPEDEKEKK